MCKKHLLALTLRAPIPTLAETILAYEPQELEVASHVPIVIVVSLARSLQRSLARRIANLQARDWRLFVSGGFDPRAADSPTALRIRVFRQEWA